MSTTYNVGSVFEDKNGDEFEIVQRGLIKIKYKNSDNEYYVLRDSIKNGYVSDKDKFNTIDYNENCDTPIRGKGPHLISGSPVYNYLYDRWNSFIERGLIGGKYNNYQVYCEKSFEDTNAGKGSYFSIPSTVMKQQEEAIN